MDVHAKLAEMRRMIEEARSMPMSASAVVNRGELLAGLDEMSEALDAAFAESARVVAERNTMLDESREEAARILVEAQHEREKLVSDSDVYRGAKRAADRMLAQARAETDGLRRETDDYVDAKLANFEVTLERTTEAVKRGRERLAGRSTFDDLTSDEIDKIRLPEHLES